MSVILYDVKGKNSNMSGHLVRAIGAEWSVHENESL